MLPLAPFWLEGHPRDLGGPLTELGGSQMELGGSQTELGGPQMELGGPRRELREPQWGGRAFRKLAIPWVKGKERKDKDYHLFGVTLGHSSL